MSNNNYENKTFSYSYPYTWEKRNKTYLKKFEDRAPVRDFIMPMVFRIRFYDLHEVIVEDRFYTTLKNGIIFPNIDGIEYWSFVYDNTVVYVTADNYTVLEEAINNGYDDIKLNARNL